MRRYKDVEDFSKEYYDRLHKEAEMIRAKEAKDASDKSATAAREAAVQKYAEILKRYGNEVIYGGLDISNAILEMTRLRYGLLDVGDPKKFFDARRIMSLFTLDADYESDVVKVTGKRRGAAAVNAARIIEADVTRAQRKRVQDVREMRLYLDTHIPKFLYFDHDDPAHGLSAGDIKESSLYRRFSDDIAVATDVNIFKDAIDSFLLTGEWSKNGKAGRDLYRYEFYPEIYAKDVDKFETAIGAKLTDDDDKDAINNFNDAVAEEDYFDLLYGF